jgi:hypothetical protein
MTAALLLIGLGIAAFFALIGVATVTTLAAEIHEDRANRQTQTPGRPHRAAGRKDRGK